MGPQAIDHLQLQDLLPLNVLGPFVHARVKVLAKLIFSSYLDCVLQMIAAVFVSYANILAMGSNLLGYMCCMTLPCGNTHLAQAQLSVVHIYQKSKISQEIKYQDSLHVYYTVVHILRGSCSIMY
jgi:hypothetical protein